MFKKLVFFFISIIHCILFFIFFRHIYIVSNQEYILFGCDTIFNNEDSFEGYGKYTLEKFEFENGQVLNDVPIEYMSFGTPKYDEDGKICNAILYCHRFNGNYSSVGLGEDLYLEGGIFDKKEYFFISTTALGFPDSCSPSTTGLKHNFPHYSIKDRVDFKRQFLKEKFGISKLHGLIGRGLGGYDVYTWACEYPDEMDFIIVGNSSYKTNGYRYVISRIIQNIINTSDDFYDDVYSDSLSRVMVSINSLLYSNYFSKGIFQNLSTDEIDVLMDDFIDEGLFTDIYDLKSRNDAILDYNVENKLKNIKAKSLIVSVTDDIYYSPQYDTMPIENLIDDVKVVIIESGQDYSNFDDMSQVLDTISEFMVSLKK